MHISAALGPSQTDGVGADKQTDFQNKIDANSEQDASGSPILFSKIILKSCFERRLTRTANRMRAGRGFKQQSDRVGSVS